MKRTTVEIARNVLRSIIKLRIYRNLIAAIEKRIEKLKKVKYFTSVQLLDEILMKMKLHSYHNKNAVVIDIGHVERILNKYFI